MDFKNFQPDLYVFPIVSSAAGRAVKSISLKSNLPEGTVGLIGPEDLDALQMTVGEKTLQPFKSTPILKSRTIVGATYSRDYYVSRCFVSKAQIEFSQSEGGKKEEGKDGSESFWASKSAVFGKSADQVEKGGEFLITSHYIFPEETELINGEFYCHAVWNKQDQTLLIQAPTRAPGILVDAVASALRIPSENVYIDLSRIAEVDTFPDELDTIHSSILAAFAARKFGCNIEVVFTSCLRHPLVELNFQTSLEEARPKPVFENIDVVIHASTQSVLEEESLETFIKLLVPQHPLGGARITVEIRGDSYQSLPLFSDYLRTVALASLFRSEAELAYKTGQGTLKWSLSNLDSDFSKSIFKDVINPVGIDDLREKIFSDYSSDNEAFSCRELASRQIREGGGVLHDATVVKPLFMYGYLPTGLLGVGPYAHSRITFNLVSRHRLVVSTSFVLPRGQIQAVRTLLADKLGIAPSSIVFAPQTNVHFNSSQAKTSTPLKRGDTDQRGFLPDSGPQVYGRGFYHLMAASKEAIPKLRRLLKDSEDLENEIVEYYSENDLDSNRAIALQFFALALELQKDPLSDSLYSKFSRLYLSFSSSTEPHRGKVVLFPNGLGGEFAQNKTESVYISSPDYLDAEIDRDLVATVCSAGFWDTVPEFPYDQSVSFDSKGDKEGQ